MVSKILDICEKMNDRLTNRRNKKLTELCSSNELVETTEVNVENNQEVRERDMLMEQIGDFVSNIRKEDSRRGIVGEVNGGVEMEDLGPEGNLARVWILFRLISLFF